MRSKKYRTASDIYRMITADQQLNDFTVIITGKDNYTDTSTLCKLLIGTGIKAIDISEILDRHVDYLCVYENDVDIDWENKIILVVLHR